MGRCVWAHRVSMLRLALSMLRSPQDAEDAVGEAMVKALQGADGLRDPDKLKPWVLRITARCCQDMLRRRKREQPTCDASVFDQPVFAQEPEDSLLQKLRALPPKQAQVLALYYYENYASREIAQVLGVPLSTVLMRLKRGRERLKAAYETERGAHDD